MPTVTRRFLSSLPQAPCTTFSPNPLIFANAVGVSTVRDPKDPTRLWTTHQYGESSAPGVWATRIFELSP